MKLSKLAVLGVVKRPSSVVDTLSNAVLRPVVRLVIGADLLSGRNRKTIHI